MKFSSLPSWASLGIGFNLSTSKIPILGKWTCDYRSSCGGGEERFFANWFSFQKSLLFTFFLSEIGFAPKRVPNPNSGIKLDKTCFFHAYRATFSELAGKHKAEPAAEQVNLIVCMGSNTNHCNIHFTFGC